MKIFYFILKTFFFFAFSISNVWSDDTYFGGVGTSVFPSKKTNVRMVSEMVRLKYQAGLRFDGTVFADCDFYFISPESDDDITMGFPAEPYEGPDDEDKPDLSHLLIRNFTVSVDGQKTSFELKKISKRKGLDFEYAFLWEVKLPKGKIVHLHHTYDYKDSGDSIGQSWVSYILKSGALWNGSIEKAEIVLDMDKSVDKADIQSIQPDGYYMNNGTIHWVFKNFKPFKDILVKFKTGEYKLKQISGFMTGLQDKTSQELRLMRNEVYARHGMAFNSKDLQEYFSKQSWYQPIDNFSLDMLSPEEKKFILDIETIEKKKDPLKTNR